MMIFHGNLRKITEIIENFVAKILKKVYTLNRYAGNKTLESVNLCNTAIAR